MRVTDTLPRSSTRIIESWLNINNFLAILTSFLLGFGQLFLRPLAERRYVLLRGGRLDDLLGRGRLGQRVVLFRLRLRLQLLFSDDIVLFLRLCIDLLGLRSHDVLLLLFGRVHYGGRSVAL